MVPSLIFIVPYRDRKQQQIFFAKQMKTVLSDREPDSYKILYIHQTDTRKFNRGAMKNIGFFAVKSMYPDTYKDITMVFNDVDTMPYSTGFLNYDTARGTVKHFYGFGFALGGIVSITGYDFEKINGFPNFWGWGYEDNVLNNRALKHNLKIDRSQFYPILDKNILHLMDGFERIINRVENKTNTEEGFDKITDLEYNVDDSSGFVNVIKFNTEIQDDPSDIAIYDLRDALKSKKGLRKMRPIKMAFF
jgi:ABC-type antimicrobial peptide transport system permease subunit